MKHKCPQDKCLSLIQERKGVAVYDTNNEWMTTIVGWDFQISFSTIFNCMFIFNYIRRRRVVEV